MASTFGDKLKITIFGQSHSEAIGCVIDGLPAGMSIDMDKVRAHCKRRAPGGASAQTMAVTSRNEADEAEILSGIADGYTCGAPLCAIIRNNDTRSKDYSQFRDCPRPSHADYTAFVRYSGFNDIRGGGQFSGRLTAPLCFAGAICMQYLELFGITVTARLTMVGGETTEEGMRRCIEEARVSLDSVGGVIECVVSGVPCGVGEPLFDSLESRLSAAMFSIPAVKCLEFGDGLALASMRGSEANDEYEYDEQGNVVTKTNHNGGILGGISNGMPIVMRIAMKPTPSIARKQQTVNLRTGTSADIEIKGRHDPCVAVRAVPVAESAAACVIADYMLNLKGEMQK